jgi:MOSC domain-containing protein YiiM
MTDKQQLGRIVAISISDKKGVQKSNVPQAKLVADWGIEGDAHAADWHRQISLLAQESIDKMRDKGLEVGPGAFAENITTEGIEVCAMPIGTRLAIGECEVEITQIGKECHSRCNIYHLAGDCVMPREGVFARVLSGGMIAVGNAIQVIEAEPKLIPPDPPAAN